MSEKLEVIPVPVGPLMTNCFILITEKEGVIIDPGGDAEKILKHIRQKGVEVKHILLTHGHFDHVGAAKSIQTETGAPVMCSKKDVFLIERCKENARLWGCPSDDPPTISSEGFLREGDETALGSETIKVMETPGHTPGGLSFKTSRGVFVGDCLFNMSIGRTDFPESDHLELMRSIKEKLFSLEDETTVFPGHGPNTTIGWEKKANPFVRVM